MPEWDPHPSAGEQPRSLLRDQGCKTGGGCSVLRPRRPGVCLSGPAHQATCSEDTFGGGQLSPRPTTLAASLPRLPLLAFLRSGPCPARPHRGPHRP